MNTTCFRDIFCRNNPLLPSPPPSWFDRVLASRIARCASLLTDQQACLRKRVVSSLHHKVNALFTWLLKTLFFIEFKPVSAECSQKRRLYLETHYHAVPFPCTNKENHSLDVLYIRSSSANRTGNVIIIADTTPWERRHPRHFDPYLKNGADVVIWNPRATTMGTRPSPIEYSNDLSSIIRALRTRNPIQRIGIKSYCITGAPAIVAVADQQRPEGIHVIVDRSFTNLTAVTNHLNPISCLPPFKGIIQQFTLSTAPNALSIIPDQMLFILPYHPHKDQLLRHCGGNFTLDMYEERQRQGKPCQIIHLQQGHHWSRWSAADFDCVLAFFKNQGITSSTHPVDPKQFPVPPPFPNWRTRILPRAIQNICS